MGARHANRARTQHVRKLNNENKEGSISATPAGGGAGGGGGTFRVSFLISASGGRCTRRCKDRSDRYAILTERRDRQRYFVSSIRARIVAPITAGDDFAVADFGENLPRVLGDRASINPEKMVAPA